MSTSDVLSVIEAAYRLDLEEGDWLAGIASAARPLLDRGLGVVAYTIDRGAGGEHAVGPIVAIPNDDRMIEFARGKLGVMPPPVAETLLAVPLGFGASSELTSREAIRAFLSPNAFGAVDTAGVQGIDISGASVWLVIPSQKSIDVASAERARWQRVAAHLAAAIRLRRSLARMAISPRELDSASAILETDGRVAEAKPEVESSLDTLRRFAVDVDRARGRTRREAPDEALELWRGLCDGLWTLIEHFDGDGRRYLVARQNDPLVREDRALTKRELQVVAFAAFGHGDKLIAYELGIDESTVQSHLSSAMRKLGVPTRLDLVRLAWSLSGTLQDPAQGGGR